MSPCAFWFTIIAVFFGTISTTVITALKQQQLPSVCQTTDCKPMKGSKTEEICDKGKPAGLKLHDRCCVNTANSTIVGIDLQKCNLTRDMLIKDFETLWQLEVISLEGNPIKAMKKADFNNNTEIKYLSLPLDVDCPGGFHAWEKQFNSSTATICENELDLCVAENVTCPDHSHCMPSGVGMTECLCDDGYFGYKCLNKGKFPFVEFGIGLGVPTVVMCIFLWVTQRRYVVSQPKKS